MSETERSSIYVDAWDQQLTRATATVLEDARTAKVTYRGDEGQRFRVIVRQKANPIGFRARLPGDA